MGAKNELFNRHIFDKDATNNLGDLVIDFIDVNTNSTQCQTRWSYQTKISIYCFLAGFEMRGARPITIEPMKSI